VNRSWREQVDRLPTVLCPACGKYGYHTRRAARKAAKVKHQGEQLRAYECHQGTGYWHIGHQTTDREFYRRTA
jgi:hypothetical protein